VNELVRKLTEEQPVQASLRPEATLEYFEAAVDRRYVHVLFPGTRGGTELGVALDEAASDLSGADFEAGTGEVTLVGDLVLDYVKVRLHARIALDSLQGRGRLEVLEDEDESAEPVAQEEAT
jgi:hypothetical protein